ncbi:GNAT family N-acetyltransferase [Amycolatopsis nigrescens]|uniref:GNAT family N-acetyltransferase n=1 Tax=Amycolatopsis nigrescens TaxID=381445 RepID=UPI0003790294|nr:GNAT family N-acetyltransferase [Amycolatopsis nigrescens]
MDISHARSAEVTELSRAGLPSGATEATSLTWRLRIRVEDRPGTLARIAIRLADLECNILGLTVLPVPGGVLDEIVVRPATGLTKRHLVRALRDEGCECSGITDADVRELVDTSAATLASVTRAVLDPERVAEVLREVLAADLVTLVPVAEANRGRTEGGHRVVFELDPGRVLVARRRWAPFVQLELARADGLLALLGAVRTNPAGPVAVTAADGAALVLRLGEPGDADRVFALHQRCSMNTLFQRYHTGMRTVPRRWLHRLLTPPRGLSLLAMCGRETVGLGQLLPAGPDRAEVSLLVEDSWQRDGVGTALMIRLATLAAIRGHRELVAVCLPGQDAIIRTAVRAGLTAARTGGEPGENGSVRIELPAGFR